MIIYHFIDPVGIRIRIGPQYLWLVARAVTWHDKDSSMLEAHVEHTSWFCSISAAMVTSLYERNILERDEKQYTIN